MFNHLDKELYFEFLNELRESGTTNMFGAGPHLENEFPEGVFAQIALTQVRTLDDAVAFNAEQTSKYRF